MKKIICTLLVLSLLAVGAFALVGCNKDKDEGNYLVVGITDYEPMDYQDENGNWIGFDADLANEFAKANGYDGVKFVLIDWDSKVMEVNSGNIDLIWNGMTADDELGTQIDFSLAYATNMQCAVVKKSDIATLTTVDAIKNVSISCEKGSAGNTVANDTLGIADKNLNLVTGQTKALLEVKSGTSKVAIVDYTMAYNVVGKNDYSDLAIVDINAVSFNKEVFAVGAKQGSDLIAKLNVFFNEKYADGSLAELAEKYGVALNDEAFNK